MPKSSNLADEPSQEEAEQGSSKGGDQLAALEARLVQVEQMAHTSHDLALGPTELQAIAAALSPYLKQQCIEVMCKHLGIAPPIVRGDGS